MIYEHLKDKKIILASKSPRRQELLKGLGISFEVKTKEVNEDFPSSLPSNEVAAYLARKKANEFELSKNELLITSDTTVLLEGKVLNKPSSEKEAIEMLQNLSENSHQVCTGVCIKSTDKELVFSETTIVSFKPLSLDEIEYYISNFKPFDKAGSYGIQEWIGFIGIRKIEGCYYNVMGLPLARLYQELLDF